MLSRVASSIYWMSRYLERVQSIARLIDVQDQLGMDQPDTPGLGKWEALMRTTRSYEAFEKAYPAATPEDAFRFLTFDPDQPNSMFSCMTAARENARSIREILTSELWQQVNELYHTIRLASSKLNREDQLQDRFLDKVKTSGLSFSGIVEGTMASGEARSWFRLGQLIERADQTPRILDVKYFVLLPSPEDVGTPMDQIQWAGLLRSASALQVYRGEFGAITPKQVAELLLFSHVFPRSARYCIREADQELRSVLGTQTGYFCNPAEQLLGQVNSQLQYATIEEVFNYGLHEYIDKLQTQIGLIGQRIDHSYFSN